MKGQEQLLSETKNRGNSNLTIMRWQSGSSSSGGGSLGPDVALQPPSSRSPTSQERLQPAGGRNGSSSAWRDYWNQWDDFRQKIGTFVNDTNVQLFVVWLIAVNAMMMGIATSEKVKEDENLHNAFETTDTVFLVIFTIELGMQFIYHGWGIFVDGWLLFDTIIIVISWSFSEVQVVRAFRIFRALRLITRIKVMKNLILALFSVIPRILAIIFLLSLVSYIFAVMFTELFKDMYEDGLTTDDYFGRIDKTAFTLVQIMTLDNWAEIAREVIDEYNWAWLPFIVFVIITGFVVVNLMIAVICEAIGALEDDDRAKLHGTYDEDLPPQDISRAFVLGDVQEQLDSLEDRVDALARMQEETLLSLENLAQQMHAHLHHKDPHSEVAATAAACTQDSS